MKAKGNLIEITEWLPRYEVNVKGREYKAGDELRLKPLDFVRLMVFGRAQSTGFRRLKSIAGNRTMEVFGIFCKFLEIAGDQKRDDRGKLLNEKSQPATAEDLAFILDTPPEQIENAITVLSHPKVHWVTVRKFKTSSNINKSKIEVNRSKVNRSKESGRIRNFPENPEESNQNLSDDPITKVFECWNSFKGKSVTKKIDEAKKSICWKGHNLKDGQVPVEFGEVIKPLLKKHSVEDICQAIRNYAQILLSTDYGWSYPWNLREFLTRHKPDQRDELQLYRFLPATFDEERYFTPATKARCETKAKGPSTLDKFKAKVAQEQKEKLVKIEQEREISGN